MNSRRTYLHTLNAGRQRRSSTTLDDLTRSLERLGERLDNRGAAPAAERPATPATPEPRRSRLADDLAYHDRRPSAPAAPATAQYQNRDAREPQGGEAFSATAGRLATEVKSLRDELRQQMSAGLQREFESLRADIARASSTTSGRSNDQLATEFERLSGMIRTLAERNDDRGVNLLRLDIEQLKSEIDTLAREESVRSMDGRWQDFDRRWNDFEHRIAARQNQDPALAALNDRLSQITDAVNNLPESLSLKSLEDKVRMLAGTVDQFSVHQTNHSAEVFDSIEQRLEEISRAIVASSLSAQSPNVDLEHIERIEARISSLSRQLESLAADSPNAEILDRLSTLSSRIEAVARQAEVPTQSVARLADHVSAIADRIDRGQALPNADEIFRAIEGRFEQFADALDRRQEHAIANSQSMFRDLESRLFDVIEKLDHQPAQGQDNSADLMDAIDARFEDFSRRMDARNRNSMDSEAIRLLEAKIDTISNRIDEPFTGAVDNEAIRNLEAQIADLSAFLSRPETDTISPRLAAMEKSIHNNRDLVIDAARRAAEDVVRSFTAAAPDSALVAGLADDLKALEAITRRSDDRNAKTFEAIHDTLLKVVDRLGSFEADTAATANAKLTVPVAPSIAPVDTHSMRGFDDDIEPPLAFATSEPRVDAKPVNPVHSAALAAAAAAIAEPEAPKKKSMLGGLTRAFSGKKGATPAKADPAMASAPAVVEDVAEPALDLDQPLNSKLANRPLEPGSGAPDLSAIIKRVRDERTPAKAQDTNVANSDFMAAARRAAKAAAAEAEVLKSQSDSSGPSRGFKLTELIKARRKPILMAAAAIMIALAGLQLNKAFFADTQSTAANLAEAPATMAEPIQPASEQASTALIPAPQDSEAAIEMPNATAADETTAVPALPQVENATPESTQAATTPSAAEPAPEAATPVAIAATSSTSPTTDAAPMATFKAPENVGPIALREAADGGDPKAYFEIASRYTEGRGVQADPAQAATWYERAAESGLAPAQYRIGNILEKGIGVERDPAKSKMWYQLAADQGNASAMHNLAVLFATGVGETADLESAARWFVKAGELGVKDSQFNLGILSAKGEGMPQNLEESYKWFALAAKSGDRDAAAKRDEVAKSLRPEQLERARATTELWKAKPLDEAANIVDIPDDWQEGKEQTASVDMKKAVQTIQLILNKNGYDAGGADGVMGQKTKMAIMAFQKDNKLPATGEVTDQLVKELLARK